MTIVKKYTKNQLHRILLEMAYEVTYELKGVEDFVEVVLERVSPIGPTTENEIEKADILYLLRNPLDGIIFGEEDDNNKPA